MHPKYFLKRRLNFDPEAPAPAAEEEADELESLRRRFAEGYLEVQEVADFLLLFRYRLDGIPLR